MPAEEAVTFALDGTRYEIDLSASHAAAMRDDLGFWVTHARRTSSGGRARRSPTRPAARQAGPSPRTGTRTVADREQAGAAPAPALPPPRPCLLPRLGRPRHHRRRGRSGWGWRW